MAISVVIIARNEDHIIETCLKSCSFADELILIDNNSTDKTAEIAKNSGARVVKFESDDFSRIRNQGMEEAKGEWVLYVDADERVLNPLKNEILQFIKDDEFSALAISRQNIIFGQEVGYGPYKKDWVIRLFKKDKFETWVGKVHEYGKFKGKLGYSKNSLLHLTHRNVDHFMAKSLEWSKIDAELRLDAGHPKVTKWRFLRILTTQFFEELFRRRGLFGGTVGIIDSVLQVFSVYITYIRLWEMQQHPELQKKYQEIDKKLIDSGFKI